MNADFKLTGDVALGKQLEALAAEVARKALAKVARKAFEPVLEAARALAPRDSGELRDAIKISVVRPSSGDEVVVVGLKIGSAANPGDGGEPAPRRWHFVELGTVHMPAQPFLRPALDQNASEVLRLLTELLAAEIERVRKKGGG